MSVYAYRRFQLRPLMRRGRKIREESCEEVVLRGWGGEGGGVVVGSGGIHQSEHSFFFILVFLPPPTNSTRIPDDVFFFSSLAQESIVVPTPSVGSSRFFFLSDPFAYIKVGYWVPAPTRHERDVTIGGGRGKKLKDGQKENKYSNIVDGVNPLIEWAS